MSNIEFHEYANCFPLLEGDAFDSLKADIANRGQDEPITRWRGKILDGRNRYRACLDLGIEPKFRDFDGTEDDALDFVVSHNLQRLHLTESQRAMVAERLRGPLEDSARKRQQEGGRKGGKSHIDGNSCHKDRPGNAVTENKLRLNRDEACSEPQITNNKRSRKQAGNLLNVSGSSVDRARAVQKKGIPSLIAMVDRDEVKLSAAELISRLSPEKQDELVTAGPKAIKAAASQLRTKKHPTKQEPIEDTRSSEDSSPLSSNGRQTSKRQTIDNNANRLRDGLNNAISQMAGIAYGFDELQSIHPDIAKEEAVQWVNDLFKIRKSLSRLSNRLKEYTSASP